MTADDTFDALTGGSSPRSSFEISTNAAAELLDQHVDAQQISRTITALLDPLDPDNRRIYLAGVLSRMAVNAVAHATTGEEAVLQLNRVIAACIVAWPLIENGENPWK